ncbi:MAG: hypothetical protein EA352_03135, partial [Gemmatimonadales bacterium]
MTGPDNGARWLFAPTPGGTGSATHSPGTRALGGKGHHLTRLVAAGVTVPPFVVLTSEAFRDHGASGHVPPDLLAAIREALTRAGLEGAPLAVRSSAADEDGTVTSFAGQFDTVLGVRWEAGDELASAILQVWASASSEHATAYRERSATPSTVDATDAPVPTPNAPPQTTEAAGPAEGAPVPMAVVLQAMVDARVSGVAFSVDPVLGRRNVAVVSAVRGLGEPLVSGDLDGDTHEVHFDPDDPEAKPKVTSTPRPQPRMLRLAPGQAGGTETVELDPGEAPDPVPSPDQVVEVARMARHLARTF